MLSSSDSTECMKLPFEVGYLPEFYIKKAQKELNETPEVRERSIKLMREILSNDIKFSERCQQESDDTLLMYLRPRKFDVSKAVSTYKTYINTRPRVEFAFRDVHFINLRKSVDSKVVNLLPYRCPDGCAIVLFEIKNWNPDDFHFDDAQRFLVLVSQQAIRDPMTQVNGYKMILDATGASFKQLKYLTLYKLYLLSLYAQKCYPARYKSFHFIHDSYAFKFLWLVGEKFLTDKLKRRVHFHTHHEELLDFFPKSVLPTQFNGDLEDYGELEWLERASTPENVEKLYGKIT